MTLCDLESGIACKITEINATGKLFYKLLDMGFLTGTSLEIVRKAPLNDPIELKVHNYLISLRSSEASLIEVEKL